MSNIVEDVNMKNQTYDFFNDIIDIETFHPNKIKAGEKSHKSVLIYYTGYVTIEKYLCFNSANLLYFIFRYVNGYFEEINGNKHLTLLMKAKKK